MSCNNGDTYVGLTDDHDRRKGEHGAPVDWRVANVFSAEAEARAWEKTEINKPGHCGGPGGEGWKYGYKYTVTETTTQ